MPPSKIYAMKYHIYQRRFMTENEKISSQQITVSNVNTLLVKRVTELENQQAKMEQYSKRNNVQISGISNEVSDENLERKVINICKEVVIDLKTFDTEGCLGYHEQVLTLATASV